MTFTWVDISLHSLQAVLVLLALALGWRDVARLFRREEKHMGTGLGRIYAIARTTMLEAWAGRIWLLPVLWVITAAIMILTVRPFDESERIPQYIKMLMVSQEILMLVIIWVMACVSIPRERERKIIVTNASKPVSRLELLLGKIAGFTGITAATIGVMCAASLVTLYAADLRVRGKAAEAYKLQQDDFAKTMKVPSEALNQLAEQGSLFAYNPIMVAPEDMSILGRFDPPTPPPDAAPAVRFIKGGSQEKISYKFTPNLVAPWEASFSEPGTRPFFEFYFPYIREGVGDEPVRIEVNAYVSQSHRVPPPKPITVDLTLSADGVKTWEPDTPDDLYSYIDPGTGEVMQDGDLGEVTIDVQCLTPNVLLEVLEGGKVDPVTEQPPPGTASNVTFWPVRFTPAGTAPRGYWPEPHPRVRGFERHDRQEISGPKPGDSFVEYAVYRFPQESIRKVRLDADGNFTMTLNLETYRGLSPDKPTLANVDIFSSANPRDIFQVKDKEVLEKRMMPISVPGRILGDPDPAKRGDLYVRVYTFTPEHSLSLVEDSVRIEQAPTPFFFNFLKGEFVLLMEAVVLISVCVVCSVRLGWPVAMFCSATVVIFGFLLSFLVDLGLYGGLGALNYHSGGAPTTTFKVLDTLTAWTWYILAVMARAVPNFTFYRFPQDYLPKLLNIPMAEMGTNIVNTAGFVLPVIAVGYLLYRRQELG